MLAQNFEFEELTSLAGIEPGNALHHLKAKDPPILHRSNWIWSWKGCKIQKV